MPLMRTSKVKQVLIDRFEWYMYRHETFPKDGLISKDAFMWAVIVSSLYRELFGKELMHDYDFKFD